jgi:hypothetical protein
MNLLDIFTESTLPGQLTELSTEKLAQYKKAASADATAADQRGDYEKGHKRFKGIVKATQKQFDNDAKAGVAEDSLNELSKNTLKSYSGERGTTIHQDQRDAGRARDMAADKKKHGNTKAAADWEDEASWLDKRAEKGAKGVAQAAIKIAKKGVAEDSVEEGWKGALAGAALAGLGALSGAPAQAADLSNFNTQYLQQVVSGEHSRPMVSVDDARAELQARADGKQQAAPARPAQSQASAGYSKEWLQKAADPNRTGRYMISVEKAQELLGNMQEGVAEGHTETPQQQKVRAAISKGLEVDKQQGDTEYKTRLDRSNKVGTVPGNYFDNAGYASDKLTGIDSIDPDGTVVIAMDDTRAAGWVKKLGALGGMPGIRTREVQPKLAPGMAEGFNGEYDDEAGMAHTNLHTITRDAQSLLDTIDSHENLPEWVQEKIVKAQAMLSAAWDYLKSQEEQGIDPRMGMNEMSRVGGVGDYRQIQTFKNPPSRDPQDRLPSHIKILIQQLKRDPKYTPEQRLELIQNLVSQHTIDRQIEENIAIDSRALEPGSIVYNGAIGVGEVLGSDGRTVRVRSWEGRENRLAPSTVRFVANRETQPTLYTWKGRPQVGVLDRLNQRFQERDQALAEQHLAELSFLGSECTKDCSGHRAGYDWSHSKGLRQGNSPYSPSFNKGAALAVAGK